MKKSVPELGGSDLDDESLGSPASLDGEGDEGRVNVGEESDDDAQSPSSSGGSELDFIEDEDDLISDGDEPAGLIEYPSGASDEDSDGDGEWQGFGSDQKTLKRGRDEQSGGKKKRMKVATFASYEDYAAMIEKGQEDDI
jgi:ribosome biogenesis protein MAK21